MYRGAALLAVAMRFDQQFPIDYRAADAGIVRYPAALDVEEVCLVGINQQFNLTLHRLGGIVLQGDVVLQPRANMADLPDHQGAVEPAARPLCTSYEGGFVRIGPMGNQRVPQGAIDPQDPAGHNARVLVKRTVRFAVGTDVTAPGGYAEG
jgi:hypothetical protein